MDYKSVKVEKYENKENLNLIQLIYFLTLQFASESAISTYNTEHLAHHRMVCSHPNFRDIKSFGWEKSWSRSGLLTYSASHRMEPKLPQHFQNFKFSPYTLNTRYLINNMKN